MTYSDVKKELLKYLKARVPLIIINTVEKERVIRIASDIKDIVPGIQIHSMSKGLIDISSKNCLSDEKTLTGILNYISKDLVNKNNNTYILTDVNDITDDGTVSRYLCDVIKSAEEKSSSIVMVTNDFIWPNLRRLGMEIELSYPSEEEINTLLHNFINHYINSITVEWDEKDYKEAALILNGLSEAEIKNTIAVLIASGKVRKEDLVDLKYAKSQMVSNLEGLEKINTENVTIAGLDTLSTWLDSKKKLFDVNNKENLKQRGLKPPRGILVVGVPGCGKSLTAKAISKKWQLPLYLLDFATVQGKYVGESERQLKDALETAEHVSPCILWIDEIEKGLSGVNDSSGVTSKMIGQFLFWLQECKKEVFVVATANDISKLPSELLRKGRFDEIFFVDLPNEKERHQIIELYFGKYLNIRLNEDILNEVIRITDGFASSDLEAAIRDISYCVLSDNLQLTKEYIINYFNNCTSISKTNPEKVQAIRIWGENRAKKAS